MIEHFEVKITFLKALKQATSGLSIPILRASIELQYHQISSSKTKGKVPQNLPLIFAEYASAMLSSADLTP